MNGCVIPGNFSYFTTAYPFIEPITSNPEPNTIPKGNEMKKKPKKKKKKKQEKKKRKDDEAISKISFKTGLYKTSLCRYYKTRGKCPYGETCLFAHGYKDLRPAIQHPHYKTEVCYQFATNNGVCPFGNKCRYIHTQNPDMITASLGKPLLA